MRHFTRHRWSIVRAFANAAMATLVAATISSIARAQPAPLPDKPFAEHRIALQLSDNDPKKQSLVISVAYNLLKAYDPDKVAIEVVTFGPGIELLRPDNTNRKLVESLVAQGVRFDVCLNTVDTIADRKRLYSGSALRSFDMHGFLRCLATVALMSMAFTSASPAADGKTHRVAVQVDQNDPQVMNLALNNVNAVIEYYRTKNEDVDIDVVAYGPGLHMMRADTSPVQDRIKRLKDMVFPGKIVFSACNNTKQGMEKAEGHAISILPDASVVPSGVVHLMELQERGWSYVRP
jgi:uncharacterized protein